MTKGVVLIAFGKRGYAFSAYNMAYSIKHFNRDVQIAVIHDKNFLTFLSKKEDYNVFDSLIELPENIKYSDGQLDPCRIKLNMYDLLPYDINLYLDVDGIALQDVMPVIDELTHKGGSYYTHVFGSRTIDQGNQNDDMVWAWMNDVWDHFKLPKDARLPSTNSSIQFIRKGDNARKLFERMVDEYKTPLPSERLRLKWGGGQPDELYLNVALAKLGWDECNHYIFLGNQISTLSLEKIQEQFYVLSIFGGKGFTREIYMEWYDRLLFKYHNQQGKEHHYKRNYILNDKHANQVNSRVQTMPEAAPALEKSLIPINDTTYINQLSLIDTYKTHNNRNLTITNHFNPAWIEFKGKRIMVYRMECVPFCTHTRLGICEVDDNYEPVKETNKLLELHSDLRGFGKGYHVEDPRLFIHNDTLYLSYTDGYQMAQATIDPHTLTASDSFYIKKPAKDRTEKNWTFFSDKGKIMGVYTICPHVIFEMNNDNFSTAYETEWSHAWRWGELRGGTSPVLTDSGYLSFFHSAVDFKNGRQYHMGAYLFEKEPPYAPIAITKRPLLSGETVPKEIPRLSNKIFVVFPGGVIRDGNGWQVAFGYNDYQCRYVKVTDELLTDELLIIKQMEEA